MSLPSDDVLASLKCFPYHESKHFEFKKSMNCNKGKIPPTICGFLNSGGGHLIFGINDEDLSIIGCPATSRDIDTFLLYLDSVFRELLEANPGLEPGALNARALRLENKNHLFIVSVSNVQNRSYKLKDGEIWYRLSASNYKISSERLFDASQVSVLVRQNTEKIHSQYRELVCGFEKELERSVVKFKEDLERTTEQLHLNILNQKYEAELFIKETKKSWFERLFC